MYKIIIAKRKLMSLNIYARQRLRHYQQHHMRINWNLERMHEWWFIFNIQTHLDYIFAIDLVVAVWYFVSNAATAAVAVAVAATAFVIAFCLYVFESDYFIIISK